MADTRISRRRFVAGTAGAAVLAPLPGMAQTAWPQPGRPIRLVVGLAAGGSLDGQARSLARRLSELAGTQVVVENKPGASMMLSATEVARAQPDGYTLLYAPSSLFAQNPHTLSSVPYDPFKDFTPVSMAARGPLVLTVHQSLPVQSAKDLVAWAKANPGKLNFASFGTGTSSHIYAMAFARSAGIEVTHVPYKGSADASRDLLEGRVQAYFDAAPSAIQNAATGRVRIVGVAAPRRAPAVPEVQTFTEQGIPGIDLTSWIAVVGPAKMPPELVARINTLVVQALNAPDVKDFFAKGAWETSPSTPAELTQEMHLAYDRWGQMVRQIGFEKQ